MPVFFLYAIGNTATDPQVLRTELATLPHRIGQLRGRPVRGLLARSLSMTGVLLDTSEGDSSCSQQKSLSLRQACGVYSIATVVDDFIDRIMEDPRLNTNPLVDEAHHRAPPAGFKYLVTEMVCWATGGPQKYTGKPMADSCSSPPLLLAS